MSEVALQGADALLMVGDSERDSDLFWATRFRAPDPFVYLRTAEKSWVMVKDLELDRAREQVQGAEVISHSEYERRLGERPSLVGVLVEVLRKRNIQHVLVAENFPIGTADALRQADLVLTVAQAPLFPARAFKDDREIEAIAGAQVAAEAGMSAAVEVLRRATIDGAQLLLEGVPLSSEQVRRHIHHALLEHDCIAHHTVVAGGEQAIDPHQAGHGPLPANKPIIIDIFPQHTPSGYYGDITRTFVRGTISDSVQHLYDTVLAAQLRALDQIRAGVDGQTAHDAVVSHFTEAGYETGEKDGRMQGFFHGTGHGVGLDIHEGPSLSRRSSKLETGHIVTVEPGLYYAGTGGVRIEDLVVVEDESYRNLTSFPKDLSL